MGKFASGKDDHMQTAKSIHQIRDRKLREAEDAEYLGRPPPDKELINASIVLPGNELIPRGMDEPGALDGIRRKYQVYITRDVPHVVDIHSDSMPRLQKAFEAINWAIRDMRLSENNAPVRFLVQKPTNAVTNGTIRAELGGRPHFLSTSPSFIDNSFALDQHLPQLASEMATSAEGLMALAKTMGLRVNFGHLIIGQRKKGSQDETTYTDFAKLMGEYSYRGGANFENKLMNAEKAEQLLQFILRPSSDICKDPEDTRRGCEVTIVANGLEIRTEADYPSHGRIQLSMVRATRAESWARMNWTVAAPDMQYDWNFRVDAWDKVDVPPEFNNLAKRVSLNISPDDDALLPIPSVNTAQLASLGEKITQIRARSWAIVPFKESDYVLRIYITKSLKGLRTSEEPEVTWGIELYAHHWEESVNHASEGRKDWGKGLENIWMEGDDLKSRLGCFMRTILEVQALLNKAHSDATS
ncbi:hypothetical protein ACHAPI_004410 [Fusarium lateritium]